jgi:hypothetical protein
MAQKLRARLTVGFYEPLVATYLGFAIRVNPELGKRSLGDSVVERLTQIANIRLFMSLVQIL